MQAPALGREQAQSQGQLLVFTQQKTNFATVSIGRICTRLSECHLNPLPALGCEITAGFKAPFPWVCRMLLLHTSRKATLACPSILVLLALPVLQVPKTITLSHNLPLSSRSCISMFFFFPYLWTQLPFSHCIPGWEPGKRMLLAGSSELPAHSHRDCRQGSCVEDAKKTWVNGNWGEHLREGPSECIRDENFVELCSQVTAKTWAQHSRQGWEYLL